MNELDWLPLAAYFGALLVLLGGWMARIYASETHLFRCPLCRLKSERVSACIAT